MAVMATKGLIEEMMQDVEIIATAMDLVGCDTTVSPSERKTCGESLIHPSFWLALRNNPSEFVHRVDRSPPTSLAKEMLACFRKGALCVSRASKLNRVSMRAFVAGLELLVNAGLGATQHAYGGREEVLHK